MSSCGAVQLESAWITYTCSSTALKIQSWLSLADPCTSAKRRLPQQQSSITLLCFNGGRLNAYANCCAHFGYHAG